MAKLQFTESERAAFNLLCVGKNFLLSFHQNPDPDSIGSNLALAYFLNNLGGNVTVLWGTTGLVPSFEYLVRDFPVLTTPISSINPDNYDRLLIVDTTVPMRGGFDPEKILSDWDDKVYVIDHHRGNSWNTITPRENYNAHIILKPDASSTAELLYDLMMYENASAVTQPVAEYLMVGIWGDTKGFMHNTDPALFEKFSQLIGINPSMDLMQRMEQPYMVSDIPVFAQMLESVLVKKINQYTVIIAEIPSTEGNIPSTHLGTGFFDKFHEADIVCVFTQYRFNTPSPEFRISIRSSAHTANGKARKIIEKLGGSGHDNAAGCIITADTRESARSIITHTIEELLS
jgi:nanoRNase/pAp phosphatase (c-di-AMP/oligoRNAs hydrolase)